MQSAPMSACSAARVVLPVAVAADSTSNTADGDVGEQLQTVVGIFFRGEAGLASRLKPWMR